jgi:hypothetical protein
MLRHRHQVTIGLHINECAQQKDDRRGEHRK